MHDVRTAWVTRAQQLAVGITVLAVALLAPTVGTPPAGAVARGATTVQPAPTPLASTTSTSSARAAVTPRADDDLGWEGPSYAGGSGSPSGSKPESKLWYAYSTWWGALWDVGSGDYHIF